MVEVVMLILNINRYLLSIYAGPAGSQSLQTFQVTAGLELKSRSVEEDKLTHLKF